MNMPRCDCAAVLLFAILGCASGAPSKTESAIAPGEDLAAYASFGWQPASEGPSASQPPESIADANIRHAIRKQLVEKGYQEVEDGPDLLIRFETAAYFAEKVSNPVRIGIGVGGWGGNVGGGVGTSVPVGSSRVEGTPETRLTIRAVDPKRNKEVWVGSTDGIKQVLDSGAVDEAVADTLAEFPARRK